jgi:hypothetical protein
MKLRGKVVLVLVIAAVVTLSVGLALYLALAPALQPSPTPVAPPTPPVDVFSRPMPNASVAPDALLPESIIGLDRQWIGNHTSNELDVTIADAGYGVPGADSTVTISVWKFASEYDSRDQFRLNYRWCADTGNGTYVDEPDLGRSWATNEASCPLSDGWTTFAWRRGTWVFIVHARDDLTRDAVVQQLPF